MKISGENLAASLTRQLQTIYLVSGDEPLLVNEAADAIRATARQQGFEERELHVIERGFDWQGLIADSRSMSLFAQRKIVEIRMANATPGEQGADAIVELAEQPSPDKLRADHHGKLDGRTQSSRWVSAVEKSGVLCSCGRSICRDCPHGFVSVWGVTNCRPIPQRPRCWPSVSRATCWRRTRRSRSWRCCCRRVRSRRKRLSMQSRTALASTCLQLGEAAMRGQTARALRILEGLRGEDVEPTLVLWAVNKDLQWIARARSLMRRGQSAESAMNTLYVWRPRQAAMAQALGRMNRHTLRNLILDAERTDRSIKGVIKADPWLELERLVARLAGVKVAAVA